MEEGLIIIFYLISAIVIILLVNTTNFDKKKQQFISHLPNKKVKLISRITERQDINRFLTDLTTANGLKNDSIDDFIKDITKGGLIGMIFFIISIFFGKVVGMIGFFMFVLLLFFPIIKRKSSKKTFKKNYISDFYVFLNYITLFLSGGIEMKTALVEIRKLIPTKSLIYKKIENMINKNAISGFSGDTYIATLDELNNGLDFPEINTFINSAKRSQARGDGISETLLIQINDIQKKTELEKRTYIVNQENTFGVFKVGLCFVPLLASIIIPVFFAALGMM